CLLSSSSSSSRSSSGSDPFSKESSGSASSRLPWSSLRQPLPVPCSNHDVLITNGANHREIRGMPRRSEAGESSYQNRGNRTNDHGTHGQPDRVRYVQRTGQK